MTKFNILILFFTVFLISCTDNDDIYTSGSDDTYKEDERSYSENGCSYILAENTKIFSDYQLEHLLKLDDENSLVFDSESDIEKLPQIGDIYVYTQRTKHLPNGFIGKISDIENNGNYTIHTEYISLEEVFSSISYNQEFDLTEFEGIYDEEGNEIEYSIVPFTLDTTQVDIVGDETKATTRASMTSKMAVTVGFKNKITEDYGSLMYDCKLTFGGKLKISLEGRNFACTLSPFVECKGSAEMELSNAIGFDETKINLGSIPLTTSPTNALITPVINIYGYWTTGGKLKIGMNVSAVSGSEATIKYEGGQWSTTIKRKETQKSDFFKFTLLEGSTQIGYGAREMLGVKFLNQTLLDSKFAYIDQWLGVKGNFSISSENLNAYSVLKPIELTGNFSAGAYFTLEDALFGHGNIDLSRSFEFDFLTKHVVPVFTSSVYKMGPTASTAILTCKVSRNLLLPLCVGYALYDESGNYITEQLSEGFYYETGLYKNPMKVTFTGLKNGTTYIARPIVNTLGITVEASPSKTFTIGNEDEDENYEEKEDIYIPFDDSLLPAEPVDLGLSVKWASYNVGATNPEDCGGYYGFGDASGTKGSMDPNDYPPFDPYLNICGNPQYDIATAKWGSRWRLPTCAEYKELIENVTIESEDDMYSVTDINGNNYMVIKFTSKINGNTLILPLGGMRQGREVIYRDSWGLYWTGDGIDQMWRPDIYGEYSRPAFSFHNSIEIGSNIARNIGICVRPVYR